MRRPQSEYVLENEAEKIFLSLPNGTKLRVLYLPALNDVKKAETIVYYTGYLSYIFIWKDSITKLRANHDIYFIETREKEFSEMSPNDLRYEVYSLAEDFYYAIKELKLDLNNCVFTGSSIASNAVLYAMGKYNFEPKLSVLATPQIIMKASKEVLILSKIPFFVAYMLKPLIYLILYFRYVKDPEARKNMIHGVSRMIQKKHWDWMKKAPIPRDYIMEKEHVSNLKNKVVIVVPVHDPAHDTNLVKKVEEFINNAEVVTVSRNSETHNERLAEIIESYLQKIKETK